MADSVWYVYGIVPPRLDPRGAPQGIEDAPVSLEQADGLAALVSALDGSEYSPERLERNTANVDWVAPRALAHDRVLSWAADRGAAVPLPMFSLFSSRDAVVAMLRQRSTELSSALTRSASGREYALRVYRVDAELLPQLSDLSESLGELQRSAESASPGQRYLLERKLDAAKKAELRSVSQRLATTMFDDLTAHSVASQRSAIPQAVSADAPGVMMLNAAFLVAPDRFPDFQRVLSEIVARHQRGFRFDFTGPWPAYHFVQEAHDGA